MQNVVDASIRDSITQFTGVEFHGFLGGRFYIIYAQDDFYVCETKEEALKKYEEENVQKMKNLVAKEIVFLKGNGRVTRYE